jgi:hypothetical protein
MVWKQIKLPRWPLARIPWQRPGVATRRKIVLFGLVVAGLLGAFYLGRQGGVNQARAHGQSSSLPLLESTLRPGASDYSRRVVAYINGNTAITREDLGEYLIDRVGADRLEFLVNRRIIEAACEKAGIRITAEEIQAQLAEDLKGFNCTETQFVNDILRRYNKTLFEWKEDVIRPKLCLQRLVGDRITVSEEEIRKGFEAKFGDKVECRIIVLPKAYGNKMYDLWKRISSDPAEFEKEAKAQFLAPLAAEAGKCPPIHHHFSDPNVEQEAFKLSKGELSPLIAMPDGTTVILRCEQRIPADTIKCMDTEREGLMRELREARLTAEIPKVFQALRQQASPQIFLKPERPAAQMASQTARAPQQMQVMQPQAPPPSPGLPPASSPPLPK